MKKILTGLIGLGFISGAFAAEKTLNFVDYSGRGFAPDLVQYTLKDNSKKRSFNLLDEDGNSLPVQIEDGDAQVPATISFVAEVAPNATNNYILSDQKGKPANSELKVIEAKNDIQISNGLLAVRLPNVQNRKFETGISASRLPAPILAFKSGDSSWLGESKILTDRKAKSLDVSLVANGPVYSEVLYEIKWLDGGFYRARIRVIDRVPVVKITEDFDAEELDGSDFWELQLAKGWTPNTMASARYYANGGRINFGKRQSLSELSKITNPKIMPDNITFSLSYLGLLDVSDDQSKNNQIISTPVVGCVPLHKGEWRKMNVIPVKSENSSDVRLNLSMTARDANWIDDTGSETSPFSMHENDPNLSTTYGRRLWALVLGQPQVKNSKDSKVVFSYFHAQQPLSDMTVFGQVRSFYGVVGLDRYKDYILDWPDKKNKYPVLFPKRKDQEAPEFEGQEFARFMKRLRGTAHALLTCPTISHHLTTSTYIDAAHADALLGRDDLPEDIRSEIRTLAALIMYLYEEPDFMSYGNGAHTGNPNMGTSRYSGGMAYLPLLQDHPLFEQWRDHFSKYAEYKMATQIAPGGSYVEYGGSYHMHGYARTTSSLPGLLAANAPNAAKLYESYHKPDWEYFMNLLTPVDPRYGTRVIPGLGNSQTFQVKHFIEAAGSFATTHPDFASQLKWAWEVNGQKKPENIWIIDPEIKAKRPELTSRIQPGLGIMFRAHQGPEETYMLFRSGFDWSHWYIDQGHMSLWSRGSVILPDQPYGYWGSEAGEKSKDFDYYNTFRFGHPENEFPYGWVDSNIIDYSFGSSVDYARMTMGIPDWFINPSINPDLKSKLPPEAVAGQQRKLDDKFKQEEGAFDWNRQILFMKGEKADSPNYFVIRDSFEGSGKLSNYFYLNLLGKKEHQKITKNKIHLDTQWDVKGDLIFADSENLKPDIYEENQRLGTVMTAMDSSITNRDWKVDSKNKRNSFENRTILRIAGEPDEGRTWLIYPRKESEPEPKVKSLGEGIVRVEHPEGTDTVFLSTAQISYSDNDIIFNGTSGSVRVTPDYVTLILSSGKGSIGYKGNIFEGVAPFEKTIALKNLKSSKHTENIENSTITLPPVPSETEEIIPGLERAQSDDKTIFEVNSKTPLIFANDTLSVEACSAVITVQDDKIRFTTTDTTYVKLIYGITGIRGTGPFDLTFTPDGMDGKVDGITRTLVSTWPEKIKRPMFHLDDLRYFAGWGDDHCINKDWETPQFSIAFGVLEGPHSVAIDEWTYPALPTPPKRKVLDF